MLKLTVGILLLVSMAVPQRPSAEDLLLARLAIEVANDREVAPISLDPDGSALHGVVYDRFAGMHLAARTAKLKGTPLDPAKPPTSLLNTVTVVVAVPLVCGERTVRPTDVDITRNGAPVMKWLPATGATNQKVLPGATLPAGAIAVQFADPALHAGETVRVSYGGPVCTGTSRTETFRVTASDARPVRPPTLDMPPGERAPAGGITLNIAGVIDLNGELRYATAPEASTPLGAKAMDAARAMRFEPARVNRSPVPWTSGVILTFGVSGAAAGDTTTTAVAGLTAESSKCPISADANYGVTGMFAIRIGGGQAEGPARIDRVMKSLRGPAGQGLDYRSAGKSLMRGATSVVLEGFEIRYAGLADPVRIYFDTSREEPLMAPKGFTCAGALR
jgi:hypothetical protein